MADIVKADSRAVQSAEDVKELFQQALTIGVPVETMDKLLTLQERVADRLSRTEFNESLAGLQDEVPDIGKSKTVTVSTRNGGSYSYNYAPLDRILHICKPLLRKYGFSVKWDMREDAGKITTTCTLQHIGGHAESSSFTCPSASVNPGMSDQQKAASANTYAQRQSFLAVTGLVVCDADTDGRVESPETITEQQAADLEALADEVRADKSKLLKWAGNVETFADIPASRYQAAVRMLERKRG